ncbi:MAG: hypothetical protein KDK48_01060, partial [Chlamydiia bacterium]|nr:hypothetical protein [Chlamydiia bacterium]
CEIREPKAYSIEVKDLVSGDFSGSLEVEFFSKRPLVFAYPATSINLYGPLFSTLVHTAERTYNDLEDRKKNSATNVAESGFNLIFQENVEPFLTLINGNEPAPPHCTLTAIERDGKEQEALLEAPTEPYGMRWIFPGAMLKAEQELECAKVESSLVGVYPRLVVGNRMKDGSAYSITHSYYDCSAATDESNYWIEEQEKWHAATLMIPLYGGKDHFTRATFYPIYSPSTFSIDVEFYDMSGTLKKTVKDALTIQAPLKKFLQLDLSEEFSTARLIARSTTRIPARIKLGYDIGRVGGALPCNICTNLQPFIPSWDEKPFTFKWCPVLEHHEAKADVWVCNSSQHKTYTRQAEVQLTFYREKDSKTLQRTVSLPPHGSVRIRREEDGELQEFFGGRPGWMTATSSNPHILTYTFIETASGNFGGDHGF